MDELEKRGVMVYSTTAECCLWAFHERVLRSHVLKSNRWRTQAQLLEYVGARATSQDVHWPLSLSLRPLRFKNYRQRSRAKHPARLDKKTAAGHRTDKRDRHRWSRGQGGWSWQDWENLRNWRWRALAALAAQVRRRPVADSEPQK